jgi:SAM-dependent methyltransferase
MSSDAANQWTKFYTENAGMMYPAEAVIRIFKGTYPNLKMPKPKAGDKILDVGCGDGRHFPLFHSLGMKASGSEITLEIITEIYDKLADMKAGFEPELRVGNCANLPWPREAFDYLLSWNACYYMNTGMSFLGHVTEMARVLKPGGWIVCSVPKDECFIFKGAKIVPSYPDYVTIQDDYFGLRNGERMRWFADTSALQESFEPYFTNFCHASIDIDMFGLAYNWHVFTAERRT